MRAGPRTSSSHYFYALQGPGVRTTTLQSSPCETDPKAHANFAKLLERALPARPCAGDAAHHFGVSRFWDVADEQNALLSECFAKLDGERAF
jgi:hypothetical protein